MRYYDQCYAIAATTILLYDFFLTLADEVSHVIGVSPPWAYCPSHERSNMLGVEGNHGVRRGDYLLYGIY